MAEGTASSESAEGGASPVESPSAEGTRAYTDFTWRTVQGVACFMAVLEHWNAHRFAELQVEAEAREEAEKYAVSRLAAWVKAVTPPPAPHPLASATKRPTAAGEASPARNVLIPGCPGCARRWRWPCRSRVRATRTSSMRCEWR